MPEAAELSWSYRFVRDLGLPTFLCVVLLGLVVYQARLQSDMAVETAKSNQLKVDLLNQIIVNQRSIITAEERAETKFNIEADHHHQFESEEIQINNQQLDLLRQLDSLFVVRRQPK